jgi:CubicO group peptidase (beta-lactamase class C family)
MIRCSLCWLFSLACLSLAVAQEQEPAAMPYTDVIKRLDAAISYEVETKNLPSFSIALVDGQQTVWSQGYGFQDAQRSVPATADTIYRVGSISKLFTDIAAMQLVERGELDLDAPVSQYLPNFKPHNPFDKPITVRQLLSHQTGLVRESPVGNYFDPTEPSLAATVESLNSTSLVYEPGGKTKYSNAALAVVGRDDE